MGNIIRIIADDARRVTTNVVALVVVLGLSVLPCLYAWFNIFSNWDPYGSDATKNLQVAVASDDKGLEIVGMEFNVGDTIVSNLMENDTIGWVFPGSSAEAINGVKSGEYYACIVINETFTQDMISFLGGNVTHPTMQYYVNEKKNAIAPKITNKVKNTIQEEVNQTFIGTMAQVLVNASEYIVSVNEDGKAESATLSKLRDLSTDLNSYILILDSYISLIDTTDSLMEAANAVSDQTKQLMETASMLAESAEAAADTATTSVETISDVLVDTMYSAYESLDDAMDALAVGIKSAEETASDIAFDLKSLNRDVYKGEQKFRDTFYVSDGNGGYQKDANGEYVIKTGYSPSKISSIRAVEKDYATLHTDINTLGASADVVKQNSDAILAQTKIDVKQTQSDIKSLITEFKSDVKPELKSSIKTVQKSVREIEKLLNYNSDSIEDVTRALSSYPAMLSMGRDKLYDCIEDANEMQDMLLELIDSMENIDENENYQMLLKLVETDPEYIADFISSPVNLSEEPMYAVANNGSATAPFYIVLSIWVGSLIMSTILKTKVHPIEGVKNLKNWECFFGRYATTFVIGQIQTIITVLGALYYTGIQCEHPFMLWLCCSWTSTVFSLLLYSFTYSFGNVGEALSVILMVIQVAGAGGTFPIEVLPKPFQLIYQYMPFAHAMNAARECVAGFYNHDYWGYMSALFVYAAIAIFIGLVLYFPCKKLIDILNKSKEKTGIMI